MSQEIPLALLRSLAVLLVVVEARSLAAGEGQRRPNPAHAKPQLITKGDQAVFIAPDGSLWSWGGTDSHLMAFFGKRTITAIPLQLGADRDWRQAAFSDLLAYGIKTNGSLWGWGWPGSASRQRQASNQITAPTRIGTACDWAVISAGTAHVAALREDGSLWAWGRNDYGQVGGSATDREEPSPLSVGYRWTSVSAGAFNTFALRQDGTLWGWGLDLAWDGKNNMVRPAMIDPSTNWIAISAGDFLLLGLKADRSLWMAGQNVEFMLQPRVTPRTFVQVVTDRDWSEIHAGDGCYLARKTDGSWWGCWHKAPGALGLGTTNRTWAPFRLPFTIEPWVLAAGKTSVFLDRDGGMWSWGPRLGIPLPSAVLATNELQKAISRAKALVPDRFKYLFEQDAPFDLAPKRIWRLPSQP